MLARVRSARPVKPTPSSVDDPIIPHGTAVSRRRATDMATSPPFTADHSNLSAIRTPASTMIRGGGGDQENLADLTSSSTFSWREATPMTPMTSVTASLLKKTYSLKGPSIVNAVGH